MTKTRIKQISFLLALVMLFGAMSLTIVATEAGDTLYSANWAVSYPYIYTSVNGSASIINSSLFPQELVLKKVSDGWYYATNSDWNADYDGSRYIKESSLTNIAPLQNTTTAQLGSFTVSVDGAIPSDAKLHIQSIAEKDVDPGIWERKDVNMKSFIACFDLKIMQGLSQWQPDGKKVTVTMNAAALGLYTGQEVYIIHMHENADGSKEYEILGPTYVVNGKFSFNTEKFSEFAIFQGEGAVALDNTGTQTDPHVIWAEQGSNITLVASTQRGAGALDTTTETVSVSNALAFDIGIAYVDKSIIAGICSDSDDETVKVTITSKAVIGDHITLKLTSGNNFTTYVTIKVGSRAEVIAVALSSYPLQIAIRKPDASGTFPSEPSASTYNSTNYHFLINGKATNLADDATDMDQSNDTIGSTNENYCDQASTFLNATQMGQSFGWMYDAQGNAIGGVIDAMGYYTKQCFNDRSIDWDAIALVIANHNDSLTSDTDKVSVQYSQEVPVEEDTIDGNANGFVTYAIVLTADSSKTIDSYMVENANGELESTLTNYSAVYYKEFNLIPYVIKLMSSEVTQGFLYNSTSDSVWHVDIALVRGDAYTLSYDLNLGQDIVTKTSIVLPTAQVFVEDPSDEDESIFYEFSASDVPKDATGAAIDTIKVNSATSPLDELVSAKFMGWYTDNTRPAGTALYGPSATTVIELKGNTKLYAIWEIQGTLKVETTTFSVIKQVHLATGSPMGAEKPSFGDDDFETFEFTIVIPYDPNITNASRDNNLGKMYFEANKYNESGKIETYPQTEEGQIYDPVTLEELCATDNPATLTFLTVIKNADATVTLAFELADGESINFLNVPFFAETNTKQYNTYTITESDIPENLQNRYAARNPEQTITLSETADARATFYNDYTPPVAGLTISAIGGDAGQYFIYEVTSTSIAKFGTIVVAVPANGSVTIANLTANETYTVTAKTAWDVLWKTETASQDIPLPVEGSATASFTYTQDGKWLFSHAFK